MQMSLPARKCLLLGETPGAVPSSLPGGLWFEEVLEGGVWGFDSDSGYALF